MASEQNIAAGLNNYIEACLLEGMVQSALEGYIWTGNEKYDAASASNYVSSLVSKAGCVFAIYENAEKFKGVNLDGFIDVAIKEHMGSALYKQLQEARNQGTGSGINPSGWETDRLRLLGIDPDSDSENISYIERVIILDTMVRSALAGYVGTGDINKDKEIAYKHVAKKIFGENQIFDICKEPEDFEVLGAEGIINAGVKKYTNSTLYRQCSGKIIPEQKTCGWQNMQIIDTVK